MGVDEEFLQALLANEDVCVSPRIKAAIESLLAALASRPPAPAWTSEPPKEAGWYLYRSEGEDYPHATWVNLKHLPKLPWAAGLWYGPIPEPPA